MNRWLCRTLTDKVIFTKNDYKLGLRNGSLGIIEEVMKSTAIDAPLLRAVFEGLRVELTESDIENLTHSYGITIHKSQGSQFKRVIVVLKNSRVLTREALYTALTRGGGSKSSLWEVERSSKTQS